MNTTTNRSFVVKNMARFRDVVQSARDKTPDMRLGERGKTKWALCTALFPVMD